ncbi:ubiquinol-cytochrome c reductase iron-sulfur subunit [Heliophilum fasciatum]|uniref:Cytochrome b6-f complex iron-sulfur subunit n=1 Tax=Heliophilum fasciatum TaxID=35700 RepID=A0A4R2RXZ1_9FIRM|nr:ubiquinol-cytochrome c reductase iron-sulfur subunit [Heliophilum fasciatum]MCW2277041.1 nitrite reductase/ring-hydroxylating ferredoxin subunit [Heliophilum fasciatum]TCP68433.1 cytochrome b6-f complex iron-sulfur subunit [Heliophilum fasciatum]
MDNTTPVSRRKFLGAVLAIPAIGALGTPLVAAGQFVYPPDSLLQPPKPKKIGNLKDVNVWESIKFDFNDAPGLLVRKDEKEVVAYSLKCTHLGCTVEVPKGNLKDKQLFCPCHGGQFDPMGNNVGGPPPKPLPAFGVEIADNGDIIISEKLA